MTLKVYPKNKWRSADTIVLRSNVKPHAEYWIASFVREESEIFVDIIQNTISPLVREACFCFRPELLLEGRSKGGRDIGQESQNLVNLTPPPLSNKSQNVGAAPLKFECFFCAELVTSVVLPHDQYQYSVDLPSGTYCVSNVWYDCPTWFLIKLEYSWSPTYFRVALKSNFVQIESSTRW